jgi:hypothetical protein
MKTQPNLGYRNGNVVSTFRLKLVSFIVFYSVFLGVQAQDLIINTADILANVTDGSTSAVITKSGTDLTITKTGGSTAPLNATYPTGAPLNTIPESAINNVEGLHLGRTWGAFGTGWAGSYGQIRSETYTFVFSKKLLKYQVIVGALNENADGVENLRVVDVKNAGVSVLSDVSFSIKIDYDDVTSDSLTFDATSRTIQGQAHPRATGWNESSLFTIESSEPFDEIVWERFDEVNTRPDKNLGGENYSNGVSLTSMGLFYAPTVLPVELLYFEAVSDQKIGTILSWKTGSEINNEGFYVLWKTKDKDWETLAFVDGFGNSNQANIYQFIHSMPSNGENYYKLAQKDFDGFKTCSDIVSVSWKNEFVINAFPNPTNSFIQFSSNNETIERIEIYNNSGYLTENYTVQNTFINVNISHLPAGIYICKIYTSHSIISKMIVVTN